MKKKKVATEQVFTSVQTDTGSTKASDDIFDEFYDDSQGGKAVKQKKSKETSMSSSTQFNPDGRYVVQVSCVLSKNLAQQVASKLQSKGYSTYIAEVENPTPELIGTYQRIRVGGFDGISQAKSFADNYLATEGYDYWIDNRSNDNVGMGGSGLGESSGSGYESSTYTQPASTSPSQSSTAPATQEWGSTTNQPATSEWGSTSTPAATQSPAPVTPAVQQITPPPAQQKPVQQPAKQQTVQQPAAQQPAQTPPQQNTKEWDDANDEWGSDTSGW